MHTGDSDDTRTYTVLVNLEGQYSLWLKDKNVPNGWTKMDIEGPKAACLQYVNQNWTDMRPLSLRSAKPS